MVLAFFLFAAIITRNAFISFHPRDFPHSFEVKHVFEVRQLSLQHPFALSGKIILLIYWFGELAFPVDPPPSYRLHYCRKNSQLGGWKISSILGRGYYSQLMSEEQQKRTKLFSVISDLSSIKEQLQQLMPPKSDARTNDTNTNHQNTQFKQSVKPKLSPQKPLHHFFNSPPAISNHKSSAQSYQRGVLAFQRKNKVIKQSPTKIEKQSTQNLPKSANSQKKPIMPLIKFDPQAKQNEKLKFLGKNQHEKNNNILVDIVTRAANQQEWMTTNQKTFSHCRHSSQQDLNLGRSSKSQLGNASDFQKQFTRQRKNRSKLFFHFNNASKQKTPFPEQANKKLARIKSDLIDHSQTFKCSIAENVELEGYSTSRQDLAERIKELEQENYQKQGIIHILEAELAEIEAGFTEMKQTIAKILRMGHNHCKNIEEVDLNEGLSEFMKNLELHQEEMQRLGRDCEAWKNKCVEQALTIKAYQESLSNYSKISLAFNELRDENCKYKDQLSNIVSKLQVSINENRIKDEFIVKCLVGRSTGAKQDEKVDEILSTASEYLKICGYPSNRLLQKLNEEQGEIRRLKERLERDNQYH